MEKLLNDLKKRFYQIEVLTRFGGNGDADEGYDIIFDWIGKNFPELNISNGVYHGVSKLVLDLFPREDFVIKIPFNGLYEGRWDEESEEYDPITGGMILSMLQPQKHKCVVIGTIVIQK